MSPAPPRRRMPSLRGRRCTGTLADKTIFACARHHHLHRTPKKYSRQRLADSRRLVPQKRPQRGEAEAVELSGLRDDANDRKVLLLSLRRPNVRFGSRLCENVHGQRMRRIVFSIGFSRQWSPALLVFKSTKSRWNFYKK